MIIFFALLFLSFNLSLASGGELTLASHTPLYARALDPAFHDSAERSNFIYAIGTFNTLFRKASKDDQIATIKYLFLRNNRSEESETEAINQELKRMVQESMEFRCNLLDAYQKELESFANNQAFADNQAGDNYIDTIIKSSHIRFYHEFLVHSIDPEDQLYYPIQYIKNFKGLSTRVQNFLILDLVAKNQQALFKEQRKAPYNAKKAISRIVHYYIAPGQAEFYLYYKISDNRLFDNDTISIAQMVENQKVLLMGLAYLRGFWRNSRYFLFAKAPDGDCGNYCLGVCVINPEKKYGALNARMLLQQNHADFTEETISRLYPTIAQNLQARQETVQQKREFLIRAMLLWICSCFYSIYKWGRSFFVTEDNSVQNQSTHPAVSEKQHEKIRLQLADFQHGLRNNTVKEFLPTLYSKKNYSLEYSPAWCKYWHLKEALVATLLNVNIRIFSGRVFPGQENDEFNEITQQEPCYDKENARDIFVWTDTEAYHDSELVHLPYFAALANAIRYENRYFKINLENPCWIELLGKAFDQYKKNWLERDKKD